MDLDLGSPLSSRSLKGGDRLLASIWTSGPIFLFRTLLSLGLCAVFPLPMVAALLVVFLGSLLPPSLPDVWMTAGVTILPCV